ncbi:hypothetical protein ACF0H5_016051 [Mactra antiquata]
MADGGDFEDPLSVNHEESNDFSKVTVKLQIPQFTVEKKFSLFKGKSKPKPKAGESEADVIFDDWGFKVQAAVTKKGKTTKYFYKVNKLPGEISKDDCTFEFDKEIIILNLVKKEADTWVAKLENGLDQEPDD